MITSGLLGCAYAYHFAVAWLQTVNDMKNSPGASARMAEARRVGAELAELDRFMVELDAELAVLAKWSAAQDQQIEALKRRRADRDRWLRVPVAMAASSPQLVFGQMADAAANSDWLRRAMIRLRPPAQAGRQRGDRIAEADKRIEELMREKAGKK